MLLNYTDSKTKGTPVVLIHGMAGSIRYWNKFMPYIRKKHRIIALDLLGFGHSPKPAGVIYSYETHVQSIIETLEHLGISQPFILVGHSMGGLIALRLAALYPNIVKKLIVIAMPVYTDAQQAHQATTNSKQLKQWAYYGPSSYILCTIWCRFLRPISSRLAPKYLSHLTEEAAQDSVLHTWQAYSQSLHYVIENQAVTKDVQTYKEPIILVYGHNDIPNGLHSLKPTLEAHQHRLIILQGGHQVVNEHPQEIADLL